MFRIAYKELSSISTTYKKDIDMRNKIIRGGVLVAALFCFTHTAHGQVVQPPPCPAGTSSVQSLQTTNNTTGQTLQNACVANNGTLTLPGVSSGGTLASSNGNDVYLTDPQWNYLGPAQWVCDAGITNTSNIVTTAATDNPFTGSPIRNAQVGDTMWASNAQCGGEGSVFVPTVLIALGTITSVDSAHQVHVSNNASASCTVVSKDNCIFVWGPNNTTPLQNAWTATGNQCGWLHLPAGGIITMLPPSNTTSLCNGPAGGNDVGSALTVSGAGGYATTILTPPVLASWNNVMFSDPLGGQRRIFHDFGIASFAPAPAVLNNQTGFNISFYSSFHDVMFLDWYPCNNVACSNNFTPLQASGVGNGASYVYNNICQNSGNPNTGCIYAYNDVYVHHNTIQTTSRCMAIGSVSLGQNNVDNNTNALCGTGGANS